MDAPLSVRDNSEVFRAVIDAVIPIEVAVKRCFIPQTTNPDESAAKEQFLALERVNRALENGNRLFRVPTPICLAQEQAAYAMSWVEGRSLTNKLRRPSVYSSGTRWLEDVGAWMGTFHKAGPVRSQLVNLDDRLAVIEELCLSSLPDKSFGNAITVLKKTSPALGNVEAEVSWLHGDCKTDNFILDGKAVYGIDISLNYANPVEYDLAQFLNNLDLLLSSPQNLHLAGMQAKLEKAFWLGYQSTGPTVSHTYLDWLRVNFLVSFWHNMLQGRKSTIRTWILNRMFKRLVDRLTAKLKYP